MISYWYANYFSRSVGPKSVPGYLHLEIVDATNKISPKQLKYLIRFCPNLKCMKFKYLPDDADMKEVSKHLASYKKELNGIDNHHSDININGDVTTSVNGRDHDIDISNLKL